MNSSNSEDGEDKVSGGGNRERLDKRQQGWKGNKSDSLGKVTRVKKYARYYVTESVTL